MRYERISVQNRRFRSNGGRLTQNFRYNGSPTPTILLLIRGLDDLSYCVKNLDRSLFRFVTMHAFGSQTDRQRGKNEMDETNWQTNWHVALTGVGWLKVQVEGVAPHHPFFFSENSAKWLLLLLHDLYSANFEDRVRGAGVARWRTWLTGEGEKVRF